MKSTASAIWKGSLKDGMGTISSASGVLAHAEYSFTSRFESGGTTTPEELIAAAHASCFSMALSGQLGSAGMTAENIRTTATVTVEKKTDGFTITTSHLDVVVKIPGADQAAFDAAAKKAKEGCPVSRVLKAEVTMNAKLEN